MMEEVINAVLDEHPWETSPLDAQEALRAMSRRLYRQAQTTAYPGTPPLQQRRRLADFFDYVANQITR